MSKITLLETNFNMDPHYVESDANGGKKFLYLKGLFLQGEARNRNGRVYPREEIARAISEMASRIQSHGPIPGELDHPEGLNMNFDRASHAITEVRMEGNDGFGVIKVADNHLGNQIRSMVEVGVRVGVSSRGSGSIDHDGRVSDFGIVTIDAVLQPSAPNAYPTPVIEAFQQNRYGKEAAKLLETARNDPAAQKYFERELRKFLSDIGNQVAWRK